MSESLGTGVLNLTVDTRGIEAGIERAKSKLAGFGNNAQKEYVSLDAATKRSTASLAKQADTFGLSKAEALAYNITLKTSGAIQEELLRKVAATNAALDKGGTKFNEYGLSAKQTTAALRQVPAQLTDIFVGLQGGQNPLTVLIQQGGQLKDVFGGVKPALAALGNAVLGLVNPLTITLGVFAAIAVALKQGSDEALSYERAIALTGNAAGVTSGQLAEMAAQIDNATNVTTHAAAAALAQVAATGKFTGDQIQTVAEAALNLQEATGRSIEKTVADFAALRDDPVDAILKLNGAIGDGTNVIRFLTPQQLRMIENLKEQGRTAEAAAVAMDAYASAINQRAPQVVKNLGTIETTWRIITQTAREAWDEMLGIGRDETVQQRIHSLQEQIGRAMARGFDTTQLEAKLRELTAKIGRARPPPRGGSAADDPVDSVAAKEALELKDRYLTKEESKKRAIAELDRLKAFYTAQEYANLKAGIEERFKPPKGNGEARALANANVKADLQAYKDALTVEQASIQQGTQLLQANYAARNVSASDYYAQQRGFLEQGQAAEETALKGQIALLQQRDLKGKDAVDTARQIAELEAQLAKVRADSATKLSLLTIQESEYYKKRSEAIDDYRDRLVESNVALQAATNAAIARVGMGAREADQQERVNAINAEAKVKLEALNKELERGGDPATHDADVRALQETTEEQVRIVTDGYHRMLQAQADWLNGVHAGMRDWMDAASNVAAQTADITKRTLDSAADAFANFALTGKLQIKELLRSILADIAKFFAKQAILKFIEIFFPGVPVSSGASTATANRIFPNAAGNPFPGGTSLPTNTILTQPTLFKFAKGGAFGVGGEAGAEAVMPLERGAGGKLGVRMYGGGGNQVQVYVNTTINSDGSASVDTKTAGEGAQAYKGFVDEMRRVAQETIDRSMMPGGNLWRAGVTVQ